MKYCDPCKIYLPEDAKYCYLCGGQPVEKMPLSVAEYAGITTLAKGFRNDPAIGQDPQWLTSLLHEAFPRDETRCKIIADVYLTLADELKQCELLNEDAAQKLAHVAAKKCRSLELLTLSAIYDLAFVLGKTSLANYKKLYAEIKRNLEKPVFDCQSFLRSIEGRSQPGSKIQFGHYRQNHGNTPQPITWIVLDREPEALLLLSEVVLDCQPFNDDDEGSSWKTCSLRRWLNKEFINKAFSTPERKMIKKSHLFTPDNDCNGGIEGGGETDDRVFLLSIEEAVKYLASESPKLECGAGFQYPQSTDLKASATIFASQQGAISTTQNSCFYSLRSPGSFSDTGIVVLDDPPEISSDGFWQTHAYGIRPALRISLPPSPAAE